MSSAAQDDLNSLTNDQLRSRLLAVGLGSMPVTNSTRNVLLNRLRKTIEGQKTASRRETMHVTKLPTEDEKSASKTAKKPANRRNTINATPMAVEDIVPIARPKQNMRRSGRITPTFGENGNAASSIAVAPSEIDIVELDEDPVLEAYVPPRRATRSPSLGKSQTVVTSYKTEVAKPMLIVESTEEEEEEEGYDDEENGAATTVQNNIYPTLPTNGFKNISPPKTSSYQSALRRTTTHTTSYEPTSYQPSFEQNYRDVPFKAPLSKPIVPTYTTSSSSGLNRRYTASAFSSTQRFDDDSATEHSDIDAPYLSDFTKRLSQLRPEPLHRKIIADVKHHHQADDSLWQSFSNLVIAFGRKFGVFILAGSLLMIVVFIYVFFIMA
ncbi:otefin [Bradysia coprophila]|uniref:otefin n=1 Tax=Bradysia coprophila TaxID=38358 RepID=UPI00187D7383|nr:otefin [Bradysia coprophila]